MAMAIKISSWVEWWKAEHQLTYSDLELQDLRVAQLFFYSTFVIPTLVYYVGKLPDARPRFPATISWTIRKGPPKWTHHILWSAGWFHALRAQARHGLRPMGLLFAIQMVITGVISVVIAPCGHTQTKDNIHYFTACLYMIDHIVMFFYWCIPKIYLLLFTISFGIFSATMVAKGKLKASVGLNWPPGVSADVIATKTSNLDKPTQKILWRLDLLEMVCEFGLFIFFVMGMYEGPKSQGHFNLYSQ